MPCNCQKNSGSAAETRKVFTVESPSGKKTSFSKQADANLYAKRVGGKVL